MHRDQHNRPDGKFNSNNLSPVPDPLEGLTYVKPTTSSSASASSYLRSQFQSGGTSSSLASSGGRIYVSKHFEVDEDQISRYLDRKHLSFEVKIEHFNVRICPFCHDTKGDRNNLYKLYIHRHTGAFLCHRCNSKGSWFDFKSRLGDLKYDISSAPSMAIDASPSSSSLSTTTKVTAPSPSPPSSSVESPAKRQFFNPHSIVDARKRLAEAQESLRISAHPTAIDYLTNKRGISKEIAELYGVGTAELVFRRSLTTHSTTASSSSTTTASSSSPRARNTKRSASTSSKSLSTPPPSEESTIVSQNMLSFLFPMFRDDDVKKQSAVVRIKIRAMDDKTCMRLEPIGGQWGFFGWNTVPQDATCIVITEGEFDAMIVHQDTGLPTISLPSGCRNLPLELLPMLERFDKIYLWMDDDGPGQEGAEQFAKKLGMGRCYIVHSKEDLEEDGPKDANDAHLCGKDLSHLVSISAPFPHSQIMTYADIRTEVYREFTNASKFAGTPCSALPTLTKIIKGHRRGELTIFTGPTGIGKTTILSQISLDYAKQGVTTLWGSFEIKTSRLVKKMLCQMAKKSIEKNIGEFDFWSEEFSTLPLYFLKFFGSTTVEQVIDAMDYATYAYDVQHIIIDNLQFMMSGQGKGYDKFEVQDMAIEMFRKFATHKNVHVTLVIHPRKMDDDALLGVSSVFGTAKATQEADNVVIIQRGNHYRFLEIKKNRYSGDMGVIPYKFDKASDRIIELDEQEKKDAEYGKITFTY